MVVVSAKGLQVDAEELDAVIFEDAEDGSFGATFTLGDQDGDGRDELLVGDATYRPDDATLGAAYLFQLGE